MSEERSTCIVCGKEYKACLSCKKITSYRPWRLITDTLDHYKIHVILSDYNNGYNNKEKTRELLSHVNYDLGELKESVQGLITSIFAE